MFSSALINAVRSCLPGSLRQQARRSGRSGRRGPSRPHVRGEQLEPRMMLDAGLRALLPDLVAASDTGVSSSDNLTSDRTPVLTGSVRSAATQVRLFIDGRRGDLLPVTNRAWTYQVPDTAALSA
ncbi:MAG: Ig-like domain-containing protein, partial [Planctomycetota bacterium]